MCIINFQLHDHDQYKLVIAANRDEFYGRPTAAAHFWEDEPELLAGRDLLQMGTWLGVTKQGRFAAVTNYRDVSESPEGKKSRGALVRDYLTSDVCPRDYLELIKGKKDHFNGFNLLVGNVDELFYYSNLQDKIIKVPSGTHSVSNHFLNTPWPKVEKGKRTLHQYMNDHSNIDPDKLFTLLANSEMADDEQLPDTGVGLDMERQLSPLFIQMPDYGTRSSTVVLVDKENKVRFIERTYKNGEPANEVEHQFQV